MNTKRQQRIVGFSVLAVLLIGLFVLLSRPVKSPTSALQKVSLEQTSVRAEGLVSSTSPLEQAVVVPNDSRTEGTTLITKGEESLIEGEREDLSSSVLRHPIKPSEVPSVKLGSENRSKRLLKSPVSSSSSGFVSQKSLKKISGATSSIWVVQLASFSDTRRAQALVKKLRAKGFRAYTQVFRSSTGGQNPKIRVLVGNQLTYAKAQTLVHTLKRAVHLDGIVVTLRSAT